MRLSPRVFVLSIGILTVAGGLLTMLELRQTQDLRQAFLRASSAPDSAGPLRKTESPVIQAKPSQEQLLQLETKIEERDRLRSELKKLHAGFNIPAKSRPPKAAASTAVDPKTITWNAAGRGTIAATFESTLRTLVESDPASLSNLIAFDDDAREAASRLYDLLPDDLRGDYANPENLVAELMVANTRPRATELVVLEQTSNGPNETSAKIGLSKDAKGNWRSATFRFQQDTGGWKLMVPALIIDGYRHRVLGTTSLAEAE